MIQDSLGDRMKENYENRQRFYLTRRTPVVIRVDGRAFHSLKSYLFCPFDEDLIKLMRLSALKVAENMQGFKIGYVQSDEASFVLTDYDSLTTCAWFDYNKSKIETISASLMTVAFNSLLNYTEFSRLSKIREKSPIFDARSFNIPEDEISNYLLWRAKDWHRNSMSMYCRSFFSAKQLLNANINQQHDMLHSIGKNWTEDLSNVKKNGTFLINNSPIVLRDDILPTFEQINNINPLKKVDNKSVLNDKPVVG